MYVIVAQLAMPARSRAGYARIVRLTGQSHDPLTVSTRAGLRWSFALLFRSRCLGLPRSASDARVRSGSSLLFATCHPEAERCFFFAASRAVATATRTSTRSTDTSGMRCCTRSELARWKSGGCSSVASSVSSLFWLPSAAFRKGRALTKLDDCLQTTTTQTCRGGTSFEQASFLPFFRNPAAIPSYPPDGPCRASLSTVPDACVVQCVSLLAVSN